MNLTFYISKVRTKPVVGGNTDVISVIEWVIEFSNEIGSSFASGETVLNTDNIQDFTPISAVNKDMLVKWFIDAEGGSAFLDSLYRGHEHIIRRNAAIKTSAYTELPFLENPANTPQAMPQPTTEGAQNL